MIRSMELFVIPTHRLCEKAVLSALDEVIILKEQTNDVRILVLDNSKDEIFKCNDMAIDEIRKRGFIIYHFGMEQIRKLIILLSENSDISYDELMEMLYPDKIDYGKIFNLLYIVAVVLGADNIYRRDSDCFANLLEEKKYPVQMEKRFLGKNVHYISGIKVQEKIDYAQDEEVCIVGGEYVGNWDLDTQVVNEANPEAMKYMMLICGIPEESIKEQFNMKYEEQEKYDEIPILSSVFEVSQSPECGNISMHNIYRYVPNFVGENGIGFDNHTYFIGFQVKVPMIYHFNAISHIHDKNRNNDIDLFRYWRGIAKMVDFDTYHLLFINSGYFDVMCEHGYGLKAIKENYEVTLPDLLEKTMEQLDRPTRIKRIETIANKVLKPTGIDLYVDIANYLEREKTNIIDELDYEYKLSIKIQRKWRKIIESAEKISRSKDNLIRLGV